MFTNDHEIATAWSDLTMFYSKTIKLTLKLCSLPHHLVLYNPNQPVTHTVASSLGSVTLITLKNFSMILSSSQLRDDFRYQLITPSMLHNSVNIHFKISERPGKNAGNNSTQHLATLLRATCCTRLAMLDQV